MRFFVTGYPRSRTAWLSVALTYGKHYCWHEGLVGCNSLDEFFERIGPDDGNSDCGLGFVAEALADKFQDSRWVVIDRYVPDVMRSLQRCAMRPEVSALTKGLDWVRENLNPMIVTYKQIDQKIESIAEYCLGEVPPHLRELCQLRIEDRHPQEKVQKHITAIKNLLEDKRWGGFHM